MEELSRAHGGACEAALASAPLLPGLLAEPPAPAHARRCLLRALLRTLRLWHGDRVTPLLTVLKQQRSDANEDDADGMAVSYEAALRSVADAVAQLMQTQQHGLSAADAAAFFSSEEARRQLLLVQPCARCALHPPHAPATHLAQAPVCAAAAAAAALFADDGAAVDTLPRDMAAAAACLCLALSMPPHGESDGALRVAGNTDEDGGVSDSDSDAPPVAAARTPHAVATACLLHRLRLSASSDDDNAAGPSLEPPPWRRLPPWLLAAACESSGALCCAYVAALLRGRKRRRGPDELSYDDVSFDAVRDAALRLRCVLAAGPRAQAAAQKAMRDWGCVVAPQQT